MTLSSRAETAIGASGRYPGIPTGAHDPSAAAGRRLRGLASLLALLAVLGGPPTALALTVGWPLPTSLPTLAGMHRALTAPLADTTVLRALACVAWLAWAHVAACVLAEARAQLGGRPRPRLPLGGPAQVLAARLVAAALVLLPTTPQLVTGPVPLTRAVAVAPLPRPLPATRVLAAEAPAAASPAAAVAAPALERAPATPVGGTAAPSWQPGPEPVTPATQGPAGKAVVVQPPQGRWHDTLWDIAARHLGDPLRYPEIYQLNRGRLQPDGNRLTRESLIQPGWVLLLPADAIDAQTLPPSPTLAPTAPDPVPDPGVQATAPPPAVTDAPAGSEADAAPAQPTVPDEPSPTSQPGPAAAPPIPTTPAGHHPGRPAAVPVGLGLGLGSLALLAALERARRAAGRRRRPGRRPAPVSATLQPVNSAVRTEARRSARDANAVQLAIRLATRLAAARGTPLPLLAVLQLPDGVVELRLAVDAPAPPPAPAPFVDTEGGWRLSVAAAEYLVAAADGDDPRPALTPVGQLADAACLVDLESAGLVGVAGDESAASDLLAAVVLALAGAPWASPVRVLADPALAGRLPALDRVELLGDPGAGEVGEDGGASDGVDPAARMRSLLAYATTTAAEVRRGGQDTLAAARAAGAGESTELVLLAGLPAAALTAELAVAALDPASPLLALSLGAHPRGVTWTLGAGGLEVPGLAEPLVPARADPDRLADVASLLTEMAATPDVPAEHPDYALLRADAPPQPAPPQPAPPADPGPEPAAEGGAVPANTFPPGRFEIAVLGPVELLGAPVPGRPVLLEICTYLALHRRGVTGEQLATALHPDGLLAAKTLRNRVGELRRLLAGAVSNGPRWRLAAEVTSDWQRFQALAAGDREQQRAALELVRGRPFDGLDAPEWLFRERYAAEVEAAVLDLAATAARDALHRGEPAAAALAAAAGLRANPDDERLRRLEMRAAAARGDLSRLRAVMSELKALVAADDDPEHAITEETRTLYGRLLREAQRRPADGPPDRRAASA